MSNEARATSRPAAVCEEKPTTWDAKRAAALWVAPRKLWGFVVRPSQNAAGMLRPLASPQGFLGATKHRLFMGHDTGRNDSVGSVVLAGSSFARASSFSRHGPGTGPRLAHSSACASISFAITSLPTESFRLRGAERVRSVAMPRPPRRASQARREPSSRARAPRQSGLGSRRRGRRCCGCSRRWSRTASIPAGLR